ncbi:hypothetical protein BDK92_5223 [Micromonospora pisi]|uniref:Uncharacterized protein n=1 Tax=Micromonospora pisi TaxID=589240 RepID=A0A495JS03_9ACTN|nr:hypothetical protein [Micromonospora pisi]RKR90839.1 hypothetical protein BDK92_5223 [Micromonospora pisi]
MPSSNGPSVEETLATADREWRTRGVNHRDRAALAADLRLDLEAAAADGVTPEQLLGPDVRGFARRLADEAGVVHVPRAYRRLLLTALAGTVPGVLAGYVFIVVIYQVLVSTFDLRRDLEVPLVVGLLAYYGTAAALVIGGALVAVRVRMREVPRIGRTVAAMSLLLPLAGVAITPVTMGFARLTDYASTAPVLLIEVALVLSALAGATVLARWWALRERGVTGAAPGRLVDGGSLTG